MLSGLLGVGLGVAAGGVHARRRGVRGLRGVDLCGGRVGELRRERRVVDDRGVLRGGLRVDVAVVLALAVGQEDVLDDLLGVVVAGGGALGGLHHVGGDLTGGGGG